MRIETARFVLRDFGEADRAAFAAYQNDARYRRLYDLHDADEARAHALFDRFIAWQRAEPRRNLQLGIFERASGALCGCAGLRMNGQPDGTAVLGIELAPDHWGRYGLAVEATGALIDHGFSAIGLGTIIGDTASGNRRVEKLALWFGARITARRDGPDWMAARGWQEVDWTLSRNDWLTSPARAARQRPRR